MAEVLGMKNSLKYIFLGGFFYLLFCGFNFPILDEAFRPQTDKSLAVLLTPFPNVAAGLELRSRDIEQPQPLKSFLHGILAADLFSRSA